MLFSYLFVCFKIFIHCPYDNIQHKGKEHKGEHGKGKKGGHGRGRGQEMKEKHGGGPK